MDPQNIYTLLERIEAKVNELVSGQAVHNEILSEHKRYSLALQKEQDVIKARLEPVEKQSHLLGTALKVAGLLFVGVVGQWLIKLLS